MTQADDITKKIEQMNFKSSTRMRERILADASQAMEQTINASVNKPNVWRIIMQSRITKTTAAAVILIAAIAGWLILQSTQTKQISSFTFLAQACAAEQSLFGNTSGIVHIANEIILYPEQNPSKNKLLDEFESDVTYDKNVAFIKGWLSYQWIPVYSLGADGQLHEHKLQLAEHSENAVTVLDLTWYDTASGRFARVLKTHEQVLFGNAYDGQFIYTAQKDTNGIIQVEKEAILDGFEVPSNPADFLGIAAGISGSVSDDHSPPIQDVMTDRLEDGTTVRTYKLGFNDFQGNLETYFLFKVRAETEIINEIECVVQNKTTRVHRRLANESVSSNGLSWDLSELTTNLSGTENADLTNTKIEVITVSQLAQRATSTAYVFSTDPSWTIERQIFDLPDEPSAPARMYCATYRGKDGRDVVLVQGQSFNRYFAALEQQVREAGENIPWTYESDNGFKAMHQQDTETEMFWTEFALKSSGFEPKANRIGYILRSPAGTYLLVAINGPVSEDELHDLVDSLIAASEYIDIESE